MADVIIIAGHLQVHPTEREAYVAACEGIVEHARNAVGCLDFALSADAVEPDRVNVFERWDSDPTLMDFREGGTSPELPEIREAHVGKYRISSEEAP